jgi:hypothetical protein
MDNLTCTAFMNLISHSRGGFEPDNLSYQPGRIQVHSFSDGRAFIKDKKVFALITSDCSTIIALPMHEQTYRSACDAPGNLSLTSMDPIGSEDLLFPCSHQWTCRFKDLVTDLYEDGNKQAHVYSGAIWPHALSGLGEELNPSNQTLREFVTLVNYMKSKLVSEDIQYPPRWILSTVRVESHDGQEAGWHNLFRDGSHARARSLFVFTDAGEWSFLVELIRKL